MKTTAKIEKHEVDALKMMTDESSALAHAMGHMRSEQREWWKRIIEKYGLDKEQGYSIDEKTGIVKAIGRKPREQ